MSVQHDIEDLLKKLLSVNKHNLAIDHATLEVDRQILDTCQKNLTVSEKNLSVNTANGVLLQQIVDDLASHSPRTTSLAISFGTPTTP